MGGIPASYFINRLITFVLTVWIAATLIWIIPRLSPVDPVEIMLGRMAAAGGTVDNSDAMIQQLQTQFGLNESLWIQYPKYLWSLLTFNLGLSIASFPTPVAALIWQALPWTVGLMLLSVIITFFIGNALGAFMVWEKTPRVWKVVIPSMMIFTAIPPILSGLLLLYLFSIKMRQWTGNEFFFPLTGSYGLNVEPGWTLEFINSVVYHGTLPALSIILVTFGFWTLGMRGLMITVQGEDYVNLAKAKGLKPRYVLYKYMVRNAILPQVTAFALKVGLLVSGQILVERIFSYNGMGKLLYDAILDQDFAVIQGVSFIIILMTAASVFIVDLIYPLLDPRIRQSTEKAA